VVKEVRITRRELAVKSLVYRAWTVCWETLLASLLVWLGHGNIYLFIAVVNAIKVAVYFGFDLGWFSFLHRPGLLRRLKRLIGLAQR
jgi:hypothetical protein